jgi:shikimate kinase
MAQGNIVLTGFMGTGKSTVGRLLAKCLQYQYIDTDQYIEKLIGCSISEYFQTHGEKAFRQREGEVAKELSQRSKLVISTGGGMLLNSVIAETFNLTGEIFCLTAPAEEILQRVAKEIKTRPLLQGDDPLTTIKHLLAQRKKDYDRFKQIDTSNKKPEVIVEEIINVIG